MAFRIRVKNDGVTAEVRVLQRINEHDEELVFDEVMETGGESLVEGRKTEVDRNDGGTFTWEHRGSGGRNTEYVRAGEVLRIE